MITPLQLDDNAPWRQRFRCNSLGYVYVAPGNPSRGIVHASLQGPTKRIFAWDTPTGDLRPLLTKSETPAYGWLGPDGDYLFYLKDEKGSELGHIVRVPFAGGPAEDLTPELPPYTLRGFDIRPRRHTPRLRRRLRRSLLVLLHRSGIGWGNSCTAN